MVQSKSLTADRMTTEPPLWVDRTMHVIIFGGGVLVLVLLLWAHLGVGALVRPPAPTALQQTTTAGPYHVAFHAPSQMTARDVNTTNFALTDATGAALTNAQVQISCEMLDMPMSAPDVMATVQPNGTYLAHPRFTMAGTWHMTVNIVVAGQAESRATFTVSVRWS